MLVKHAASRILTADESFDDLVGPVIGKQRLAALTKRIAAKDPILLDPQRFAYLRNRAVSTGELWGPNDNGDYFGHEELSTRHGTFVYDPEYVDHDNTDAARAYGIVIASIYHGPPKPGGWVEIIIGLDRQRASKFRVARVPGQPDLLTAIRAGHITDTSMGCFVQFSLCSICGNRAEEVVEYCPHIANFKGMMVDTPQGKRLAYEDNRGVTFFEDSIITTRIEHGGGGADQNAKILSEVAAYHGPADWTDLIVDRKTLIQVGENAMNDKKTEAAANAPAVGDPKRMTQVDVGDYFGPGDNDKSRATFDQSKGKSGPGQMPVLIDNPGEKLAINPNDPDYPHSSAGGAPTDTPTDGNLAQVAKTAGDANPVNTIGGKPAEVLDAEKEQDEKKASETKDAKTPETQERSEEKMDQRHDDEDEKSEMVTEKTFGQRAREFVGKVLHLKVNQVRDGEGIRVLQDYIRQSQRSQISLLAHAKESVSQTYRRTSTNRVAKIQHSINKATAIMVRASVDPEFAQKLDKMAEQYGGNPQQLVDFADVYEIGNPDANTLEQSKGTSPADKKPSVGDADKTSQDPASKDHPPKDRGEVLSALKGATWTKTPKGMRITAGKITLAEPEAGQILDRIEQLMAPPTGMSYSKAEERALEEVATRITSAKVPLAQKAVTAEKAPAQALTGRRANLLGRLHAVAVTKVALNVGDKVQPKFEVGTDIQPSIGEIVSIEGNEATVRWPWGEMPGHSLSELAPASQKGASMDRTARPEPYGGEDPRGGSTTNAEAQMDAGTGPTLSSPATKSVTDGAEFVRSNDPPANRKPQPVEGKSRKPVQAMEDPEKRLDVGNEDTLESPSTGDVSEEGNEAEGKKSAMDSHKNSIPPRDVALSGRDAYVSRIVSENKRLRAELESIQLVRRRAEAKKIAVSMFRKGMFITSGNVERQQAAAQNEFVRLCKLSPEAFGEAKRMSELAVEGSRVPAWTRRVPIRGREGSVREPVNQSPRGVESDETVLSQMFTR